MGFLIEPSFQKRKSHYVYCYREGKLHKGNKKIYKRAKQASSTGGHYAGRKGESWKVYKKTPSNKILDYQRAMKIQKTMPPKIIKVAA